MIVGDIHDDYSALNFILQKQKDHGCRTIVFLGDYVDRGTQGPEVLLKVFQLKIKDPKHVILLRGNHEDINMNVNYGFFDEIDRDEELQWALDAVYKKMPIAAILSQYAFCVHGGITHPESVSCINKKNAFQYMWNDPTEHETGLRPSQRGSTVRDFGPDVVHEFLHMNNLDVIIRGHTALMPGYAWLFDRQLLSLFSCPNYCGAGNRAAYAILDNDAINVFDYKNTGRAKKFS
jgi:serine/threonine-protein phosphatase PP1 catalytic subunit